MSDRPSAPKAPARPAPRPSYDDLPYTLGDLPPELRAPLERFDGETPPAPAWFAEALANAPERGFVQTPRGRIESLTWGERGKPGLLFIHGNGAHADWWSFICPFFAQDYRVTAMSLAGMGGSDWRERYGYDDNAEDAEAVARATGLYDGGRKPVYVGHSFGGGQVLYVAGLHPDRLHAAIIVDAGFGAPPSELAQHRRERLEAIRALPPEQRPARTYATLAKALARFRLSPPQPAENLFIVDHIARHGLKRAPMPDGSGEGWTWKFDPDSWEKLDHDLSTSFFASNARITLPIAHLYAQYSPIPERVLAGEPTPFPPEGLVIQIPEAYHHVMIDQPIALVLAIRTLLAAWRA